MGCTCDMMCFMLTLVSLQNLHKISTSIYQTYWIPLLARLIIYIQLSQESAKYNSFMYKVLCIIIILM